MVCTYTYMFSNDSVVVFNDFRVCEALFKTNKIPIRGEKLYFDWPSPTHAKLNGVL